MVQRSNDTRDQSFRYQPLPPLFGLRRMMIKSARFSALAVFAALLCFAPSALGESSAKGSAVRPGDKIVDHQPSALSASAKLAGDHGLPALAGRRNDDGWGDQGWGGGGWGGGNGGGWGGGGNGGGGRNGGGVPVPEGGTNLIYLSLTGLSCVGAMAFRARRGSASGIN